MTKDEALKLALEALNRNDYLGWQTNIHVRQVIKEALAQPEQEQFALKHRIAELEGAVIGLQARLAQQEQEPVAWLHTKIEGVAVPHRPADLDKHPDRWEALYKTPPPCPTCEALARTVMLDQTSHDTHPPQRTWVGLTDEEREEIALEVPINAVLLAEAKLKEKNT